MILFSFSWSWCSLQSWPWHLEIFDETATVSQRNSNWPNILVNLGSPSNILIRLYDFLVSFLIITKSFWGTMSIRKKLHVATPAPYVRSASPLYLLPYNPSPLPQFEYLYSNTMVRWPSTLIWPLFAQLHRRHRQPGLFFASSCYLNPSIGGRHRMLYFNIQRTEKYSIAMCYKIMFTPILKRTIWCSPIKWSSCALYKLCFVCHMLDETCEKQINRKFVTFIPGMNR